MPSIRDVDPAYLGWGLVCAGAFGLLAWGVHGEARLRDRADEKLAFQIARGGRCTVSSIDLSAPTIPPAPSKRNLYQNGID